MSSLKDLCHLHLSWIIKHPNFIPIEGDAPNPERGRSSTYYESMKLMYDQFQQSILPSSYTDPLTGDVFHNKLQIEDDLIKNVLKFFRIDLALYESYESKLATFRVVHAPVILKDLSYFATIGFNHQTYSIPKCIDTINRILKFSWIITLRAIFEIHRENGLHPHIHILLTCANTKNTGSISKIVEKLWATKDIKHIVLKKSFIDVKKGQAYHTNYVNLIKVDSKAKYIVQDIAWRKLNNIPEFFEKSK